MNRFRLTSIIYLALTMVLATTLGACRSDKPDSPGNDMPRRTVMVYMVADNDLGSGGYERADLQEMQRAIDNGALAGGRLLVYRDTPDHADDRLVELRPDTQEQTLVTYSDGLCAVDTDRMKAVMADSRRLAPADSYGIIFWSHGTGWISEPESRSATPRSFGLDNGRRMKITSLAEALEPTPSDWIYFDCCHMGLAEIVYELRHCAGSIVASTTELPLEGMPYDLNLPLLFKSPADLTGAARTTCDYYKTDPDASTRSCAIAVYDTGAFDRLAAATGSILADGPELPSGYEAVRYGRMGLASTIFDMPHYIKALNPPADKLEVWNRAYADAIVYAESTPVCYGIDMSDFTGLGCFIAKSSRDLRNGYTELQWWTDVVSRNPRLEE